MKYFRFSFQNLHIDLHFDDDEIQLSQSNTRSCKEMALDFILWTIFINYEDLEAYFCSIWII